MNNNKVLAFIDNTGNKIEAHGGHIIAYEGHYYWYGEDRRDDTYVRCYRSIDLQNWQDCGPIISISTPISSEKKFQNAELINEHGTKINLERPKVIYNKKHKYFVMYMHYENGVNYDEAAVAVAYSRYPDREFIYLGHYRPFGYMSRDCTLFIDDNDVAYFISAANENKDLHFYRLSENYLEIEALVSKQFVGLLREAPAVIKDSGIYYIFTSYCTGWHPNQCQFAFTTNIEGSWSKLYNIGDETTYHSQPAFILRSRNKVYYVGDVWGGYNWTHINEFDYTKSTYLVLALTLDGENTRFTFENTKTTIKK